MVGLIEHEITMTLTRQ